MERWAAEHPAPEFQSTHPVRGATADLMDKALDRYIFQSTHPVRGATVCGLMMDFSHPNFNPRTP